jgi:hypothetical protein
MIRGESGICSTGFMHLNTFIDFSITGKSSAGSHPDMFVSTVREGYVIDSDRSIGINAYRYANGRRTVVPLLDRHGRWSGHSLTSPPYGYEHQFWSIFPLQEEQRQASKAFLARALMEMGEEEEVDE